MSRQVKGTQALLIWCKRATEGYKNVCVENFHTSWRDGLAFCALVHKYHPEAINFNALSKENCVKNNQIAFDAAEKLGVPALLEAEDMIVEPRPDQFSVMTYISQMYHVFETKANPGMGIANISVDGNAGNTGNTTTKNSPRSNSTANTTTSTTTNTSNKTPTTPNHQRKISNTSSPTPNSPLPSPKQPTNPPATPTKPSSSSLSINRPALNTPNRNSGYVNQSPRVTEENLQINKNQQPVDPNACAKCGKELEGEVIEALERAYHQKCFGCHKCGRALKAKFVPVEGWPYCEGCGRQAFVTSRLQRRSQAVANADAPAEDHRQQQVEIERQEKERADREREERDRQQKADKEKREREEKAEKERKEKEKLEKERKEKEAKEKEDKLHRERKEREDRERQEAEKKEKERQELLRKQEQDKKDKERQEKEKVELARKEKERQEAEKKEKERIEKEKMENEKREKERIEKERQEEAKKAKEAAEKEKNNKEKDKPKTVVVTLTAPPKTLKLETTSSDSSKPKSTSPTSSIIITSNSSNTPSSVSNTSTSATTLRSITPPLNTNLKSNSSTSPTPPSSTTPTTPTASTTSENRKSTYIQEHIKKAKEKKEAEEKEEKERAKRDEEKKKKEREDKTKESEQQKRVEHEEKTKKDAENKALEEKERIAKEKEDKERKALEEKERIVKDKEDKERREREDREKKARERDEKERKEKEAREREEKLQRERKEREERDRQEAERREKEERIKELEKMQKQLEQEKEKELNNRKTMSPKDPLVPALKRTATHKSLPVPPITIPSSISSTSTTSTTSTSSTPSTPSTPISPSYKNTPPAISSPASARKAVPPLPLTPTSSSSVPAPFASPLSSEREKEKEKVIMEGFLMKQQPTGLVRMWQQRYFILYPERLVYFRAHMKPNTPPHGIFSLRLIHSVDNMPGSKFSINIEDKVWNFEAETDEEKEQWVVALNEACRNLEPVPVPALTMTSSDKIARKEGWLGKLGFFGFTRMWVVLRGGVISYSETPLGKQQGRVLLYKCKLEEYDPKHKKACFMATPLHESSSLSIFNWSSSGIVFQAKDEMEMHEWLNEVVKQKVMIEDIIDNFQMDE